MDRKELYTFRQKVAKLATEFFQPDVVAEIIEENGINDLIVQELALTTQNPECDNPSLLLEKTAKRWSKIFFQRGITDLDSILPEALAAFYVIDSLNGTFEPYIERGFTSQDSVTFITCYDIHLGGVIVAQDILKAAALPNLITTKDIIADWAEHNEKTWGIKVPLSEQIEIVLRDSARTARLQILFNEDPLENPRGMLLINESAKQARGLENRIGIPSQIPPFLIPGFVDFGATFTEQLYPAIYPHAVELYDALK